MHLEYVRFLLKSFYIKILHNEIYMYYIIMYIGYKFYIRLDNVVRFIIC